MAARDLSDNSLMHGTLKQSWKTLIFVIEKFASTDNRSNSSSSECHRKKISQGFNSGTGKSFSSSMVKLGRI
jgi:hypothetical protein